MKSLLTKRNLWTGALGILIFALAGCQSTPADASGPGPVAVIIDPLPLEPMADLTAHDAVKQMGIGYNIGNTLENTTRWETGWGQPVITQAYVESLAKLGFKTIRLPVAWDTYAVDGVIQPAKMKRVGEVVNWITGAGMFCILNIHWDGGWIDSSVPERFPDKQYYFSAVAEKKFRSYWTQISTFFQGKSELLVFEGLNEETQFQNDPAGKYETLKKVNQLFIDTVRATGGNNAKRLLLITGPNTNILATYSDEFEMPTDSAPDKLFISVHYYTPFGFAIDPSKKARLTWGTTKDLAEMSEQFDLLKEITENTKTPVILGEFAVPTNRDPASRKLWYETIYKRTLAIDVVPVSWDIGLEVSRLEPYDATDMTKALLAEFLPVAQARK